VSSTDQNDKGIYKAHQLVLKQALPKGTTMILRLLNADETFTDDGETKTTTIHYTGKDVKYWYYKVVGDETTIDLTQFTEMGGTAKFNPLKSLPDPADETKNPMISFAYQVVVDFSNAETSFQGDTLEMDMQLTTYPVKNIATVTCTNEKEERETLKIHFVSKEDDVQFSVSGNEAESSYTGTATAAITYTPVKQSDNNQYASIWDNRALALVLTTTGLPKDTTLVRMDGSKETSDIYYMSEDDNGTQQFIIPVSSDFPKALDGGQVSVTLKIKSKNFNAPDKIYSFDTILYVSSTGAGCSPLNGVPKGSKTTLYFAPGVSQNSSDNSGSLQETENTPTQSPSLLIKDGTHLLTVGDDLRLQIQYQNIPAGSEVNWAIYKDNDPTSKSVKTGTFNLEQTGNNSKYAAETMDTSELDPGSYMLQVTVTQSDGTTMDIPYYFIVLTADNKIAS
jgi:hypothetical protein